ncbi:hypothetical protein Ancab_013128 [Ancistrocladus abbreviatus]
MDPNPINQLSPPPPPPPLPSVQSPSIFHISSHTSSGGGGTNFPVIAIAIIGILATAFLLVSYYVFVIKCCLNWHRIDFLRRLSLSRGPSGRDNHRSSIVYSPAIILSRGLDESVIRSIPIIRFRKEAKKVNTSSEDGCYYECAVCLSEFREGEKLRVIPNCCHAFHIDCIDVWLQTNANCPLCRSSISSDTLRAIDRTIAPRSSPQDPTPNSDNFSGNDEDYVVIELQDNNLDEPRLVSRLERLNSVESPSFSLGSSPLKPEQRKNSVYPKLEQQKAVHNSKRKVRKIQHVSSMGDECIDIREKDDEFRIQPLRRSISMDSSNDRQLYLQIQEILQQQSRRENEGCSSRSVRRSFFSFSNGRG